MGDNLLDDIDDTIHAKARLGIMALLLSRGEQDFTALRRALGLSDGNLGAHLRLLEEAGYVEAEKGFVNRKPRTTYRATEKGRQAFLAYVEGLERLLRLAGHGSPGGGEMPPTSGRL